MPAEFADAGDFLASVRALEAAGAEMIGVAGDSSDRLILLGAIAAITERVRIRLDGSEPEAVSRLGRGRTVVGAPPGERWVELPMPADRDAWAAMAREAESSGAAGVTLPWDPRLIDLLRNPE